MQTNEQKLINEAKALKTKRIMHTKESFPDYVRTFSFNYYSTTDEYNSIKDEMNFKHETCGKVFPMTPRAFLGSMIRCPDCDTGTTKKRNLNDFTKLVNDLVQDEYTVLSEYKNDKIDIKFLHNTCGRTFEMRPNNFTSQGQRCPHCAIEKRNLENTMTEEEYVKRVKEVDNGEYIPISKYTGSKDTHEIKHLKCNKVITIVPSRFFYKDRCPYCSLNFGISKAMIRMYNYLEKFNIKYKREYIDSRCKNKNVLPFDISIKLNNGKTLLIEYDGEQHFKPVFGGNMESKQKTLLRTQFHDGIKNAFCETYSSEYVLERIPYTDEKILENKLYNILNKYKLV